MKIKTFLSLLLLSFISVVSVFGQATPKSIPLKGESDNLDERSIFPKCIYASTDGLSLFSEFTKPIGEVSIVITDFSGVKNIIQESVLVTNEQSHTLSLYGIAKGDYVVRYYFAGKCLYGEFKIE